MSELAVKGCSFDKFLDTGKGSVSSATLTVKSQASGDVLVGSNGVYFDKLSVQISNATVTLTSPPEGATSNVSQSQVLPVTIDIKGTADNILDASDNKAVQKDDEGEANVNFLFPAPQGATVPATVKIHLKVSKAGQTDVIAL